MERAAKKKDSLAMVVIASMIVWVSACLLSSAASASSATPTLTTTAPTATHVALKSRAEVFLGVSLKNVERSELSPVNATRYYDVSEGVVLECLVAPVKGLRQTGSGFFTGSADEAYDAIRASSTDVATMAKNTGIKPANIQKVKDHVFNQEHLLDRYVDYGVPAEMRRFDSDLGMANAWKRLESGTHRPSDLQLLRHEAAESHLMRRWGDPSYNRAHNRAQQRYPYQP